MSIAPPVFVSYSTNCEDVVLNRLFINRDSGFYVDVGAAHPLFGSDTKALYDRGWRGINIEPNVALYQHLVTQRPGDHNINAAVSDLPGQIIFYEVIGADLSTCDPEEAARAEAKGFEVVRRTVDALSLRQILEEIAPPEIDLLKVDVEGFEMKVLSSNDWRRFRPKVVLVEVTFPESPHRRPDVISPYLQAQDYRRVYFDGLNDYYIARDFNPPSEVFDRPPNVFDHFERYELYELKREREYRNACAASLHDELHKLKQEDEGSRTYIASLQDEVRELKQERESSTARITSLQEEVRELKQEKESSKIHIASIHGELAERCRALVDAEKSLRRTTLAAEAYAADIENARSEVLAMRERCRAFATQLEAMHNSTSWRITRPLRGLARPRRTVRILLGRSTS
jgi:FkbM family methyltransferase